MLQGIVRTTAGTLCLCAVATRLTCLRVHVAGHCGNDSWYSVSMCSGYQVDMFNDMHVAGHCGNDSWYSVVHQLVGACEHSSCLGASQQSKNHLLSTFCMLALH